MSLPAAKIEVKVMLAVGCRSDGRHLRIAAAWAALGLRDRAVALLHHRLDTLPLSSLIKALLDSLLSALEGQTGQAVRVMQGADVTHEPEILVYFARHYSFLGLPDATAAALKDAAGAASFVLRKHCAKTHGSPHFVKQRNSRKCLAIPKRK